MGLERTKRADLNVNYIGPVVIYLTLKNLRNSDFIATLYNDSNINSSVKSSFF